MKSETTKRKSLQQKFIPSVTIETQAEEIELITENHFLLDKFDNDIEEVQQAQNKMIELSGLINTFSQKVLEQDMTTDQSK